jgi:hypothetical protein
MFPDRQTFLSIALSHRLHARRLDGDARQQDGSETVTDDRGTIAPNVGGKPDARGERASIDCRLQMRIIRAMSSYRPSRQVDSYGIHDAPLAETARAPWKSPSNDAPAASVDWSKHRRPQPVEFLLPISEQLLDELPPDVFPGALASQYARIVNLIALQWNDRESCGRYFNGLLNDQRGGRQGFPELVRRDLLRLAKYWYHSAPALDG